MGNNRHKYFNKVPPFKPDPEHYTRKQHSWKAKESYETENDALGVLAGEPEDQGTGIYGVSVQDLQQMAYRT